VKSKQDLHKRKLNGVFTINMFTRRRYISSLPRTGYLRRFSKLHIIFQSSEITSGKSELIEAYIIAGRIDRQHIFGNDILAIESESF